MEHFIHTYHWLIVLFAILIVFDLVLKLFAFWRSARNNQLAWFICIGIINTAGILPLIYLLFFSKQNIQNSLPK